MEAAWWKKELREDPWTHPAYVIFEGIPDTLDDAPFSNRGSRYADELPSYHHRPQPRATVVGQWSESRLAWARLTTSSAVSALEG
jgi:hypothetical protein